MGKKLNSEDLVIYKRIDEILYFHWNPIGVDELPRDEYATYVPQVYNLKKSNATIDAIATNLYEIETNRIGVIGSLAKCREVAKMINEI